jgi:hypothetical protein
MVCHVDLCIIVVVLLRVLPRGVPEKGVRGLNLRVANAARASALDSFSYSSRTVVQRIPSRIRIVDACKLIEVVSRTAGRAAPGTGSCLASTNAIPELTTASIPILTDVVDPHAFFKIRGAV